MNVMILIWWIWSYIYDTCYYVYYWLVCRTWFHIYGNVLWIMLCGTNLNICLYMYMHMLLYILKDVKVLWIMESVQLIWYGCMINVTVWYDNCRHICKTWTGTQNVILFYCYFGVWLNDPNINYMIYRYEQIWSYVTWLMWWKGIWTCYDMHYKFERRCIDMTWYIWMTGLCGYGIIYMNNKGLCI